MRLNQFVKTAMVAAVAAVAFSSAVAADITGAGATFPYPIYSKWAESYKAATGTGLNYQSIGSGGGIKQIKAKTVDFGASDMPLKQKSWKLKACSNSRPSWAASYLSSTWTASPQVN